MIKALLLKLAEDHLNYKASHVNSRWPRKSIWNIRTWLRVPSAGPTLVSFNFYFSAEVQRISTFSPLQNHAATPALVGSPCRWLHSQNLSPASAINRRAFSALLNNSVSEKLCKTARQNAESYSCLSMCFLASLPFCAATCCLEKFFRKWSWVSYQRPNKQSCPPQ